MRSKLAIVMLVIVLLAAALVQSGKFSYDSDHGIEEVGSSGTHAFGALLKETYPEVSIQDSLPKTEGIYIIPYARVLSKSLFERIRANTGKSTFVLYRIPISVPSKRHAIPVPIKNYQSEKPVGKLTYGFQEPSLSDIIGDGEDFDANPNDLLSEKEEHQLILEEENSGQEIAFSRHYKGSDVFFFHEGENLINRNLAKDDNAAIALGLYESANPKHKPATLVTGYLSPNNQKGLVERMGPIIHSAWNQLLVLVAVIFFTLNIRFGRPQELRATQRGSRELVDGLGAVARRRKLANWALQTYFDHTFTEIERRKRTSRNQLLNRPEDFFEPDEAQTIQAVTSALTREISDREALQFAKRLKRLV